MIAIPLRCPCGPSDWPRRANRETEDAPASPYRDRWQEVATPGGISGHEAVVRRRALALVLAAGFAALVDLGEDVDLTKRHNVVLLMTIALMLLAIAAVLVVKGLLVLDPLGVTMVASGQLAA